MFHYSQKNSILASDHTVPCKHLGSLTCINARAFTCCCDTFFSIVIYSVNVYILYEIIQFHDTCTILCLFYLLHYCSLFNFHSNKILLPFDQCCDITSPWEYVEFSEAEVDISGMITAGQRWLMIFLGILSLYIYTIE